MSRVCACVCVKYTQDRLLQVCGMGNDRQTRPPTNSGVEKTTAGGRMICGQLRFLIRPAKLEEITVLPSQS